MINTQINDNTNYYQGTTTAAPQNGYWGQPQPNVCPGCGRCKDCGRPYEAAPVQPSWPYSPFWYGTTTCGQMDTFVQAYN